MSQETWLHNYIIWALGAGLTVLCGISAVGVSIVRDGFDKVNAGLDRYNGRMFSLEERTSLVEFRINARDLDINECKEILKNHEGRLIILERIK